MFTVREMKNFPETVEREFSSLPRENYKFEQSDYSMRLNNTSRLHQVISLI